MKCWLGEEVKRSQYEKMDGKEKEAYNASHLRSVLATRGFVVTDIHTDKFGADLVAYKPSDPARSAIWIQLKSRLTICKKYLNKNLFVAFPENPGHASSDWFIYPHDSFVTHCSNESKWVTNENCWHRDGGYSSNTIPAWAKHYLEQWKVPHS